MNASKAKGGAPDERLEGAVEWLLGSIEVRLPVSLCAVFQYRPIQGGWRDGGREGATLQ